MEDLLSKNRIWLARLAYVGKVSKKEALNYGFTGVMLRATGLGWDIRDLHGFNSGYEMFPLNIPVGTIGDCYDRYVVRLHEMRVSCNILIEANDFLLTKARQPDIVGNHKFTPPPRRALKISMESLINHFKYYTEGLHLPNGFSYGAVEAPKGEFGISVLSSGNNLPFRLNIRSPGFFHLQGMECLMKNHLIADLTTIIGTLDLVFGEIDR